MKLTDNVLDEIVRFIKFLNKKNISRFNNEINHSNSMALIISGNSIQFYKSMFFIFQNLFNFFVIVL